jgi:hypothetical protein
MTGKEQRKHRLDGKIELIRMSSSPPRPLLSSARRSQPTTRFATPACAADLVAVQGMGNGRTERTRYIKRFKTRTTLDFEIDEKEDIR